MEEEFEVFLQGGSPWGFRLQGGKEFRVPLKISRVEPGGKAAIGGVKIGDNVLEINGNDTSNLYHTEALTAVKKAQYSLSLVLKRPEEENNESNEPGHSIQSISLVPEDTKTRVSLTIGQKNTPQPSGVSPRNAYSSPQQQHTTDVPIKRTNVPSGQAYMQKLVGSLNDLDDNDNQENKDDSLPSQDRERSKTLPKSYGKKKQEELQRQRQQQQQQHQTNSLPRSKSSSENAPLNKAPHWYKDMYKQMHTSMEGESHLSKLLSSDAKRGAFRKYDGVTTPTSHRSLSPDERRSSFGNTSSTDAPRRLQGGLRSLGARNHPHRKSLPNLHASNFNFMNPDNFTEGKPNSATTVNGDRDLLPWQQKAEEISKPKSPSASASTAKKSVNSEWYRQLQKGGEIPETGLAAKKGGMAGRDGVDSSMRKSTSSGNIKTSSRSSRPEPFTSNEPPVNRQEKQTPVDFLELRRQELKNQELEKEREEVRKARERERLAEEERLKRQNELDKLAAAKERDLEPVLTSPSLTKSSPPQKAPWQQKDPPSPIHIEPEEEEPEFPEFGRAKYSFHPQGPGELEFRKGDTVRILRGVDDNWLEGELNGLVGIFPISYVEFLEQPTTPSSSQQQQQQQKIQQTPPKKQQESPKREEVNTSPKVNGYHHHHHQTEVIEEPSIQPSVYQAEQTEPEYDFESVSPVPSTTQEFSIEEGLGKARYTFQAESDSELSFKKGDMITILKQVDDNWYEGELNDQIGIFPSNYIEILKDPVVVELEPRSEKKYESNPADLDFEQIFSDVLSQPLSPKSKQPKDTNTMSYEKNMNAINNAKNQNGYHDEEEPQQQQPQQNDMEDLVGKGEPHRAVYHYRPANEDEVELKVGDIVHVLEKCDDGWFIGTCERTSVFGTFPGNYVIPA